MARRKKYSRTESQAVAAQPAPSRPPWWRSGAVHLAVLAALTAGIYAGALRNAFVADDDLQIEENQLLTSYANLPRLLRTHVWAFAQRSPGNYYRPVQMAVYLVERHAFGLDPAPWHLVELLLHFAVLVAIYGFARSLGGPTLGFWTSVWFALHPVHVEAVVWVAALPELLCAFSLFAGILCYHRAREAARPFPWHAAALAFFALAVFSKETGFVFPGLVLAHDFLLRRDSVRELLRGWRRYLPQAALLVAYTVTRVRAIGGFAPARGVHHRLPLGQALLSIPALVARYVGKTLVPVHLNFYYLFHPVTRLGWLSAAGMLLLAAMVFGIFRLRSVQPLLSFAIAWFLLTLAPALSIANVGENVFTERYLYIPSFGFALAAAWAGVALWNRAHIPAARYALGAALVGIFLFYAVQTLARVPVWHDDLALFSDTVLKSPESGWVESSLGNAYYEEGELVRAVEYYRRATAVDPSLYYAHFDLALALSDLGQDAEALEELQRADQLKPSVEPPWELLGEEYARLRQWDRAIDCYRQELRSSPDDPELLTLLGLALDGKGDVPAAVATYRRVLELRPGEMDASINLAIRLAHAGDLDEAVHLVVVALRTNPGARHADKAYYNLGTFYEAKQQWQEAEAAYGQALSLNPDMANASRRLQAVEQILEIQRKKAGEDE